MSKHVDTIQSMIQAAMSRMFEAEKEQDQEKMDKAFSEYSALSAAVTALQKATPRMPRRLSKPQFCRCPSCLVILNYEMRCCDNCGQTLDWGRS